MDATRRENLRTVAETAAELHCSRASVYRAIGRGELEAVRLGEAGPLRVREAAVDGFLVPAGAQRRAPARARLRP